MLFGMESDNKIPSKLTDADIHIVINISTNELGDVRSYYDEVPLPPAFLFATPTNISSAHDTRTCCHMSAEGLATITPTQCQRAFSV